VVWEGRAGNRPPYPDLTGEGFTRNQPAKVTERCGFREEPIEVLAEKYVHLPDLEGFRNVEVFRQVGNAPFVT
jgi:hypothetical protein